MNKSDKTGVLRVYVGESDKIHGRPLFEEIVFEARNAGLAGATVFKGVMSFGASHSIHTMKIFALSSDMPITIEIVDNMKKLNEFTTHLNDLMEKSKRGGMITIQELNVVWYERGEKYKNK